MNGSPSGRGGRPRAVPDQPGDPPAGGASRISWRASPVEPPSSESPTVEPPTVEQHHGGADLTEPAPARFGVLGDGVPAPWTPVVPLEPALADFAPPTTPPVPAPATIRSAESHFGEAAPEETPDADPEATPAAPVRLRLVAGGGPRRPPGPIRTRFAVDEPDRPAEPVAPAGRAGEGDLSSPGAPEAALASLADLAQSARDAVSTLLRAGQRAVAPLVDAVPRPCPVPRAPAGLCAKARAAACGVVGFLRGPRRRLNP